MLLLFFFRYLVTCWLSIDQTHSQVSTLSLSFPHLFAFTFAFVSTWIWVILTGSVPLGQFHIAAPKRSGKRHNLASTVKKCISAYSAGKSRNDERETASVQRQKQSAADLLSKAVRAKIEDGNVKAAVGILLSEDTPAVPFEESWRGANYVRNILQPSSQMPFYRKFHKPRVS